MAWSPSLCALTSPSFARGCGGAVPGSDQRALWNPGPSSIGVDPTFGFMTVDHDGRIRMDPSSPYAMAGLVGLKDRFQVAFANDPDADRHGIVTRSMGLMNPNHYLAVAIRYLLTHRPQWPAHAAVGKTLVSSRLIDRVVRRRGRRLYEVPVGFKCSCRIVRRFLLLGCEDAPAQLYAA